eukprot:1153229-Pelagomonas_calceolata.AAC.11
MANHGWGRVELPCLRQQDGKKGGARLARLMGDDGVGQRDLCERASLDCVFWLAKVRSSSAQAARQASSSGDTGPRSDQHQVDALMRSDSPVTCPQVALLQKRALMQASSCGGQGEASNAPVTCPLVPPLQNCALWCKQALAGIKAKPAAAC